MKINKKSTAWQIHGFSFLSSFFLPFFLTCSRPYSPFFVSCFFFFFFFFFLFFGRCRRGCSVALDPRPEKEWDCESILSTRSTLYNHPTKLKEQPRKIKLDKRGMPVRKNNNNDREEEQGEEKAEEEQERRLLWDRHCSGMAVSAVFLVILLFFFRFCALCSYSLFYNSGIVLFLRSWAVLGLLFLLGG